MRLVRRPLRWRTVAAGDAVRFELVTSRALRKLR
jgi:hypothetical protein